MVFGNQSSDFVLGVEFGGYKELMSMGFELERKLYHNQNKAQLMEAAKCYGYNFYDENIDETWSYFSIKKAVPNQRSN